MKQRRHHKRSILWWAAVATIVSVPLLIISIALTIVLAPQVPKPSSLLSISPTATEPDLGIAASIPPLEAGTTRILVMKFKGDDMSKSPVSAALKLQLQSKLREDQDTTVDVQGVNASIGEFDGGDDKAGQIGAEYHASIVVWGWIEPSDTSVKVGFHFVVIHSSDTFPSSNCPASKAAEWRIDPEDLQGVTLETDLANEYTYATLFSLGLAKLDAGDFNSAIVRFNDASAYLSDGTLSAQTTSQKHLFDYDLLYYYRGLAYEHSAQYQSALADFNTIKKSWAGDPYFDLDVGITLLGAGDLPDAIQQFSSIEQTAPSTAIKAAALLFRGASYYRSGKLMLEANQALQSYAAANVDFNAAVALDWKTVLDWVQPDLEPNSVPDALSLRQSELVSPNLDNSLTRFLKGDAEELTHPDQALSDYGRAIDIAPNFLMARYYRYLLYMDIPNYSAAIGDILAVTADQIFQTPCLFGALGVAYSRLGIDTPANDAFSKVIELTTAAIAADPRNGDAYYFRGIAEYHLGTYPVALRDFVETLWLGSADATASDTLNWTWRTILATIASPMILIRWVTLTVFGLAAVVAVRAWVHR